MKLRKLAVATTVALAVSLLSVLPAQARMTPANSTGETALDAAGLIVKYKANIDPIAPNGEPTGENFAGVDLENSTDLGAGFKSVDFAIDLHPSEVQSAVERIALDPRVESASVNQVFQAASYAASPIAGSILPNRDPVDLPIVIRTAVKLASAPVTSASDAWTAPNRVGITLTWSKPSTRVSGKIAGYKVQLYSGGTWKTLVTRTSSAARSFTTNSLYLKAGVPTKFRVAAVTLYGGRYYTGVYRTVYGTPTNVPKPNTRIQVQNVPNEMRFSWAPLTNVTDLGGLQVSYQLQVLKNGTDAQSCTTSTATTCVISPVSAGESFTSTLTITNDHGSVTVGPVTTIFALPTVDSSNDQFFINQWHLKSDGSSPYGMKVTNAWSTESGSPDVYVAVLDTGITTHPDLQANVVAGYDMISDAASAQDGGSGRDSDATDTGDYHDENGSFVRSSWHGTHVAGIIAAADNNIGVLGVAPNVKIIPVRVLGANGGTEADIVAGLNWVAGRSVSGVPAIAHRANVINMSIGGQGTCFTNSATATVLRDIKTLGITVVTAAGNDSGLAELSYPGNCVPTINVSAVGKTGKPTFYSNYGQATDIAAPGGDYCYAVGATQPAGQIYSTLNDGIRGQGDPIYAYELGTSMASPNVAGVVALMYSALFRREPNVIKDEALVTRIWAALNYSDPNHVLPSITPFASSSPPANPSNGSCVASTAGSHSYGAGIVNAEAAVAAIIR